MKNINIKSKLNISRQWMYYLCLLLFLTNSFLGKAESYDNRYGWPAMKTPKGLIICNETETLEEAMLLESLSGLAAKAVNENRFSEMVWMDIDKSGFSESYGSILKESVKAVNIKDFKRMNVWELLTYLKKKGLVKGYVLYNMDDGKGEFDNSSNVATVYASLLSGVLIDHSLEVKACQYGLKMLKDATKETLTECFHKNKSKLNNATALSIRPYVHNLRDYAIAHKLMLYSDNHDLANEVLEWVKPLTPILGWGCGDEYDGTSLVSEWGHYNTASDWCYNLPFISAAAPSVKLEKAKELSLNQINFADTSYVHSFVMSDGDNMQWTMGVFARSPIYAGNEKAKDTGVTWTICPINLSVISPVSWNEAVKKQSPKNSYIEYGGGYQYPDLFAIKRPNRKELLREFARRVNKHMKDLDVKIYGALFKDVDSKEAQEALQIYVEEMEDITGIIAIQYFPYELGKQVYWFKNKKGIDIPVVTADYSIWNEVRADRPNAGTPEYVASLINRDALSNNKYSWTIVHAWSDFEETSNLTPLPAIGMNPVMTSESLLMKNIRTVSLNELLWRVRMLHRPEQTKSLMK